VTEASENSLSSWNEWRIFLAIGKKTKNDYRFSAKKKKH
jgi:hypothetical protein